MNTAAPSSEFSTPALATQHMCRVATEELLKMTLRVAAVAMRLVEVESGPIEALAQAAEAATRGLLAAPGSMEAAIEAGRVLDASEAVRETMTARMASVMETFKKASRAVRLTTLLAQRIERPLRPERDLDGRGETRVRAPGQSERSECEAAERLNDREPEDEIGDRSTVEIIREICGDLGIDTAATAELPAAVRAVLATRPADWPVERSDGTPSRAAPDTAREPDTPKRG